MGTWAGVLTIAAVLVPLVAILALPAAALTWRFVAPERPRLADLVFAEDDPDAELPRMRSLSGALTAAVAAYIPSLVVGLALAMSQRNPVWVFLPNLAVVPPAALATGLLVLVMWPSRPALGAPADPRPVRLSDALPRWLGTTLIALAGTLGVALLVGGLLGVRDPTTGYDLALGVPSVVSWRTSGDQVSSVEYTPDGVTVPWPGFSFGIPIFAGYAACIALATSLSAHLTRRAGPLASARGNVDVATRRHVVRGVTWLAVSALCLSLAGTLALTGSALESITLIPQPSPDGLNINQEPTFAEPGHAFGVLLSFLAVPLTAVALIAPWWAVGIAREFRAAARAARTKF